MLYRTREPALAVLRWVRRTPLVPSFALSVLGHALLLRAMHVERAWEPPRFTTVVVTLGRMVPTEVRPPGDAPPAAQAEPTAQAKPTAQPEPALPDPVAAPTRQAKESTAPAASEQPGPAQGSSRGVLFYPAEELGDLPVPLVLPDISAEWGRQLAGRRVLIELRIDPFGAVRQSTVLTGEINPEVVVQIDQALANATFVGGRRQGKAVGAILRTRLCFDLSGGLDASSSECWGAALPR